MDAQHERLSLPDFRYQFLDPAALIASDEFRFVEDFLRSTGRTQIGWHYITDLTWIYSQARHWPRATRILDAGGGSGPTQFLLAELGFNVTNVDLYFGRPPLHYEKRYRTSIEVLPSYAASDYVSLLKPRTLRESIKLNILQSSLYRVTLGRRRMHRYIALHERWRTQSGTASDAVGKLRWIAGNLCSLPEILPGSFDAVVSLSALEHIPIALVPQAIGEINRILAPEALWAVTTSGTEQLSTWFHEPSKGLCFSESDIQRLFHATPAASPAAATTLQSYRDCDYLRENLADFYRRSGSLGMPWGKWDPKYIPFGIYRG